MPLLVLLAMAALGSRPVAAANGRYVSANFVVTAATNSIARGIAAAAEEARASFARQWLDGELPTWRTRVQIIVEEQESGGDGSVVYERYRGAIENVRITVRGPLDRIFEYVLPHEIAHAVLAMSLRQPVPRWLDEGIALLCESQSQQTRQQKVVVQLLGSNSLMDLSEILRIEEYPREHRDLVGFYASSYSLTEFLVGQGGRQRLLRFAQDGGRIGWDSSFARHYGGSLDELESAWRDRIAHADSAGVTRVAAVELHQP